MASPNTLIDLRVENAEQVLAAPLYKIPQLGMLHTIVNGIKYQQSVVWQNEFGLSAITDPGCGDPANDGGTADLTEKVWAPNRLAITKVYCYGDYEQKLANLDFPEGVNVRNLGRNKFLELAMGAMFSQLMWREMFRIGWFADSAITANDLRDNTGAADAAKVPYFNQYDGFWKQILALNGGTPTAAIAKNAENTEAGQLALGATDAYDALVAMYNNSDSRLKAAEGKMYVLTDTLYTNLLGYIEDKANYSGGGFSWVGGEHIGTLHFRGIPVYAVYEWDNNIQGNLRNATTPAAFNKPHRGILTTKENLRLGFDLTGNPLQSGSVAEIFEDQRTQQTIERAKWMQDSQIPFDYMIATAY